MTVSSSSVNWRSSTHETASAPSSRFPILSGVNTHAERLVASYSGPIAGVNASPDSLVGNTRRSPVRAT